MTENRTDILVVGATFAGIGMALTNADRAAFIEPSGSVGPEFISAMRYGVNWGATYSQSVVEQIKKELHDRNALDDRGYVHLPALHPVICRSLHIARSPIQFLTHPMSFKRIDDEWQVSCVTPSGVDMMRASYIIDTRSDGVLRVKDGRGPKVTEKLINVSLYDESQRNATEELREAGYRVQEGRFPGEVTWSLSLEREEGWFEARKKVGDMWSNRPSHLRSWTIAATATAFDIRIEKGIHQVAEGFYLFPSSAYDNPLAALQAGCEYMQNLRKGAGVK